MPALSYSYSDFTAYTKIKSVEVNAKFNDIKTLLNTTKLDTDNVQLNGLNRNRLATGTASHVVINGGDGNLSSEAQLAKSRGGTGVDISTTALTLNKELILPEQATPSTPASGFGAVYFKSDGKLYQLNDGGTESQVGAGGGGDLNFLTLDSNWAANNSNNKDAEASVGDWAAYNDAAATSPVDMTGGSPTITLSRITSSHLNGSASFKVTVPTGASRQGEGVSCIGYVPEGYRGRTVAGTFAFTTTGTLTEDDFRIFAYDITNSEVITPTTYAKIIGSRGKVIAVFPTKTNTASLRFGIHIARSSNTGAVDIIFDDVVVTPALPAIGLSGSDQSSNSNFTPNNFGTVSATSYWVKRVGDVAEVTLNFTGGTLVASTASITLPFTIDSAKYSSSSGGTPLGHYISHASANTTLYSGLIAGVVFYDGSDTSKVYLAQRSGATSGALDKATASGAGAGNNLPWTFTFRVAVAGWSSNMVLGQSSTTRISSYLASGTRVTGAAPTKLGEYRSYLRNAGANTYTETNGSPAATPTVADGIKLYGSNGYASADTNNEPSKFDIFVGKNKNVQVQWYSAAAKTGYIDVSPHRDNTTTGTGANTNYDPSTGILGVWVPINADNTASRNVGFDAAGSQVTDAYFDVIVSEPAIPVGIEMPRSEITLDSGNGHGSTNTKVRRWSNTRKSIGSALSYTDSATLGGSITVLETGVYAISYNDLRSASTAVAAIVIDGSAGTTNVSTPITYAQGLRAVAYGESGSPAHASWCGNLTAGQIIWCQGDGSNNATDSNAMWTVTKVSN